jgi:hypothetical protein
MTLPSDPSGVPAGQQLNYGDIRNLVEDGDVVLFRGTIFFSRAIEKISHGAYSHCAIATNWGERKMLLQAELMGGIQAVPMSVAVGTYTGRVDWYKIVPAVRRQPDRRRPRSVVRRRGTGHVLNLRVIGRGGGANRQADQRRHRPPNRWSTSPRRFHRRPRLLKKSLSSPIVVRTVESTRS